MQVSCAGSCPSDLSDRFCGCTWAEMDAALGFHFTTHKCCIWNMTVASFQNSKSAAHFSGNCSVELEIWFHPGQTAWCWLEKQLSQSGYWWENLMSPGFVSQSWGDSRSDVESLQPSYFYWVLNWLYWNFFILRKTLWSKNKLVCTGTTFIFSPHFGL